MQRRGRGRTGRGDEGVTLIELMAAVTLMGIAMVAILGALGVMVTSSREHRQMANAQVVLASAAEKVKGAPFVDCAITSSYSSALSGLAQPSDWSGATVVVTSVVQWTGSAFDASVPCVSGTGLQQITVRVTSPDGATTDSVSLVKAAAAPAVGGAALCVLRNPSSSVADATSVQAGAPATFRLHLVPNSCQSGSACADLFLSVPGLPLTQVDEVSNCNSADPTWQKTLTMPVAATPGWGTIGNLLTAVLYDEDGREAGRFLLRVS